MFTDKFGNTYYKVALHQHTTRSDGSETPEAVVARYKSAGYDAIALTDHWFYSDDKEIDGLPIISGCEYNTGLRDSSNGGVMHIIGVGMAYDPQLVYKESTRQEIIDAVRAAGGLAFLAHPNWSLNTPADVASLTGLSAVEVYNSVSDCNNNFRRADSTYFVDICANQGWSLPLVATDDSHAYGDIDNCIAWTMVRAKELSTPAILDAIKRGDCYATQGPWIHATWDGEKMCVHCSPCSVIAVMSNYVCTGTSRTLRGEGVTYFEYVPQENEKWLRAEVKDADGHLAWSNITSLI